MANLDWLMDVGKRRGFTVYLNVTEHRKNWFDLPNVFRFAGEKGLGIHINHCVSPDNITLYNLPEAELRYVLEYWRSEYARLYPHKASGANRDRYEYLMSLAAGELKRRTSGWEPFSSWSNRQSNGRLAVPIPGLPPFDRPKRVAEEALRISRLPAESAMPMLRDLATGVDAVAQRSGDQQWAVAAAACRSSAATFSASVGVTGL
jgi:hypothetical protein